MLYLLSVNKRYSGAIRTNISYGKRNEERKENFFMKRGAFYNRAGLWVGKNCLPTMLRQRYDLDNV